MPISKRQRFEIFKRDGFKCAYCGRTPPDVLLHVDHIVALANGGTGDPTNLITACADCNLGKAAVPLTAVSAPLERQAQEARERAEQVRAYAEATIEARAVTDETINTIEEAWFRGMPAPGPDRKWAWRRDRRESVRQFLALLPVPELLEAVDIAHRALARHRLAPVQIVRCENDVAELHDGEAFRYFCGICWKSIKEKKGI